MTRQYQLIALIACSLLSAFAVDAQILRVPLDRLTPATVEMEEEIVDTYTARKMIINAGDLRLCGPLPRPFNIFSGSREQSMEIELPYKESVECAMYLLPEGAIVPGPLDRSIRECANKLEAATGTRAEFVRDDQGLVRISPPKEIKVREFYNGDGEVVTRERVRAPRIFGKTFYEIDYVLDPGTPYAEAIGEIWFNLGDQQALILLKTTPEDFEAISEVLRKSFRDFYQDETADVTVSLN